MIKVHRCILIKGEKNSIQSLISVKHNNNKNSLKNKDSPKFSKSILAHYLKWRKHNNYFLNQTEKKKKF